LFLEALKLYSEQVVGRITRTLNESSSPLAGFQILFDELIAGSGTETGALGCFMVNSVAELVPYDPDVTEIAAKYSDALQRLFTKALTQTEAEAKVKRRQTPEQLAAYVFNAMQGLRILIKSGAAREQVQAISAITLNNLK
jgi:TetR/AcrR family transcriptional regulator, transcriptional repressor for nem operon